jgi:hypothetical protein
MLVGLDARGITDHKRRAYHSLATVSRLHA